MGIDPMFPRVLPVLFLLALLIGCAARERVNDAGDEWSGWYSEERLLGESDWYKYTYGYADPDEDTGERELYGYYENGMSGEGDAYGGVGRDADRSGFNFDYYTRGWFDEKGTFEQWRRMESKGYY